MSTDRDGDQPTANSPVMSPRLLVACMLAVALLLGGAFYAFTRMTSQEEAKPAPSSPQTSQATGVPDEQPSENYGPGAPNPSGASGEGTDDVRKVASTFATSWLKPRSDRKSWLQELSGQTTANGQSVAARWNLSKIHDTKATGRTTVISTDGEEARVIVQLDKSSLGLTLKANEAGDGWKVDDIVPAAQNAVSFEEVWVQPSSGS